MALCPLHEEKTPSFSVTQRLRIGCGIVLDAERVEVLLICSEEGSGDVGRRLED